MEPTVLDERHAIGVAHTEVLRCAPTDSSADVAALLRDTPWEVCAVVNDAGVLLGSVGEDSLEAGGTQPVSEVMHEGPQTVRADEEVVLLGKRMDELSLERVFVTDPDGRLLGLVTRADVQAASIHSSA